MGAWISPDVKSFGCVNTFFFLSEMLKVSISLFKKKKRNACKWIMSIGWTAHLTGVHSPETLRWFTIWGKQIGSDNTGWSMLPISPAGNGLERQGNDFCKHFLEFWASLDPTPFFSWRIKNWGNKYSLPLFWEIPSSSPFLYVSASESRTIWQICLELSFVINIELSTPTVKANVEICIFMSCYK